MGIIWPYWFYIIKGTRYFANSLYTYEMGISNYAVHDKYL
ncbi:unnamed protein product [marine sediment metagenome]|uniref:Uncharacterized protein n=1 Tax=marine sediment metagenome TaxID=412755 RepID=X0Y655_9ZZZZ